MATAKAYREFRQFSGDIETVILDYDFSKDGGAAAQLDLLKVKEGCVLVDAFTKVVTACTSGGSATLIVGVTGNTDAILASTAVAALTIGAVLPGDAACKQVKMAADDIVSMTIGTAAFTAGKIQVVLRLMKF